MTKNDVKDWKDLQIFARTRAKGSAKRNDPWAWAYWRNTALWAEHMQEDSYMMDSSNWLSGMGVLLSQAKTYVRFDFTIAALFYSRAKWLAIMLRNRGIKVPRAKGPSLDWLHTLER